jgi:hypothetical protein
VRPVGAPQLPRVAGVRATPRLCAQSGHAGRCMTGTPPLSPCHRPHSRAWDSEHGTRSPHFHWNPLPLPTSLPLPSSPGGVYMGGTDWEAHVNRGGDMMGGAARTGGGRGTRRWYPGTLRCTPACTPALEPSPCVDAPCERGRTRRGGHGSAPPVCRPACEQVTQTGPHTKGRPRRCTPCMQTCTCPTPV